MSGFNYLINLQVLNGSAFSKLSSAASSFETALESAQGEVHDTSRAVKKLGDDGRRSFDGMAGSVRSWIAGLGIGLATLGSLNVAAQSESLEKSIVFASGSAIEGQKNLDFLRQTADQLGLSLKPAQEGFKTLSGSLIGTGLNAQQARDIFHGVASASSAMGLSAEDSKGAFIALGQMASKGKVSAEELRGQLGERLSGAFYQAAAAMGVNQSQFDKMLSTGEVMANDFLPKFASQLEKTFGQAALNNTDSATANFNRMQTAIYDLQVQVGTGLIPVAMWLIKGVLVPLFDLIGNNIPLVFGLAGAVAALTYRVQLQAAWTVITTAGTWSLTGAMTALNAAIMANPVGFLIAGLVALGGAVVWAWQKFEGFRGFIYGMWEVIKELGRLFWERVITPFMSFGKIVAGIFTFDTDLIASGMSDAAKFAESWSTSAGERVGNAFTNGWNNGVSDFKGAQTATDAAANAGAGAQPFGGANFNNTAPGGNKPAGQAKEIANGITGGGGKNVTINVGKLIESFSVNTTNMKEGAQRAGDEVLKQLLQALNQVNQVQTN